MNSEEMTCALYEINAFHKSLDEHNPMTFTILLEQYYNKLSDDQIVMIKDKIENLLKIQNTNNEINRSRIDTTVASIPLLEKTEDYGSRGTVP